MKATPFFSIVIPTYNRAADLEFALYCILRQSFSDFEIVISDNCSTDNTQAIVHQLDSKKIRYSRTTKTVGNALNMKRVIEMAKGRYIFLHSDDDFFLYKHSLEDIYKETKKHDPGYVRINYMSLSMDKKRVFSYKVNKPFIKNEYIPPFQENIKIAKFIVDSDPYFITGIIFKNILPKNIKMVDSDPAPWIGILFYSVKNFGASFIRQTHIVASWSRRITKQNTKHHIFVLINGKLRAENYFNVVKKKLDTNDYMMFLHKELMTLYVSQFPGIKVHVGNKIMLQMAARIEQLDPAMKKSFAYWIYLLGALIIPRIILKFLRDMYVALYARFSKVRDTQRVLHTLELLEKEYSRNRLKV